MAMCYKSVTNEVRRSPRVMIKAHGVKSTEPVVPPFTKEKTLPYQMMN